jgi:hypothetical protein
MANSAEQVVVRAQDVVAVRRAQKSFRARWPRGPRMDIAQEAAGAVSLAVREPRPEVVRPRWVPLPQLVGLRPLD